MTNAKRLTFIWKRQTVSGKRGENMVTWSLLPFAVNTMLNLPTVIVHFKSFCRMDECILTFSSHVKGFTEPGVTISLTVQF